MKTLRLIILLALVTVAAKAVEISPNERLRARIKAQVQKNLCAQLLNFPEPSLSSPIEDPFGEHTRGITRGLTRGATRERTRGITRGLTRGADNRQTLPPEVESYNKLYAQNLQAEFGLPYGHEDDPNAFHFFKKDIAEAEKVVVLNELGIEWADNQDSPKVSPDWMTMAKNYRQALASRHIDLDSTFVPALILYKKNGEKFDYLIIDPLAEAFPADMENWKVLTKDVQFNLPFQTMMTAMKNGKFPLLDAVHDLSHFISFLRFAELTKSIRQEISRATETTFTPGFKRREYWLTESLSVLDPQSGKSNKQFLRSFGRPVEPRGPEEIKKDLAALNTNDLLDYALASAKYFESQLRDISGGNSNAGEKWYYLGESFGVRAEDLLNDSVKGLSPLAKIMEMATSYFDNQTPKLNVNKKAMTNETITFSFSTFITAQKLLALTFINKAKLGKTSRAEALEVLLNFVSRTEFLLSLKPVTYAEWAQSMLQANLPLDHPVAQLLLVFFSKNEKEINDFLAKYYLGPGLVRPKN